MAAISSSARGHALREAAAARLRKPKGEDVEIGDRAIVALARLRDDRVLRHGQVAADAKVGLDEGDPDVHVRVRTDSRVRA